MAGQFLLEWFNLFFVIPFGLAFMLLVAQILGLDPGHHEVDHDHDHDLLPDTHAHEHEGEGPEAPHAPHPDLAARILSALGLGRIPLSLALMTFGFVFGFTGYALNVLLLPVLVSPWLFFPVAVAGAGLGGLVFTGAFAGHVAKFLPKVRTHAASTQDLTGRIGETLYALDAEGRGTIRVRDAHGNLQQFAAFTAPPRALAAAAQVLLVRFDPAAKAFEIEPCPDDLVPRVPPGADDPS